VPIYKVYVGRAEVAIGYDAFQRTIDEVALSAFTSQYSSAGWEPYCRIRHKNFFDAGFPGTVSFRSPDAGVRNPTQGYRVQMPAGRSGTFEIWYQVVCPVDRPPTGRQLFSSWNLLGDYTLGVGESLVRGMPPIESVGQP
jgi:hypothetical protein